MNALHYLTVYNTHINTDNQIKYQQIKMAEKKMYKSTYRIVIMHRHWQYTINNKFICEIKGKATKHSLNKL